jgi:hypothetical protein
MKRWADIPEWERGLKHPNTSLQVYKNVRDWDHIRLVLHARCVACGFVLSQDEKAVKEIAVSCDDPKCTCQKFGPLSHRVCSACYDMHHALYNNLRLKDMNYFKSIDEQEKRDQNDPRRRDRLGI